MPRCWNSFMEEMLREEETVSQSLSGKLVFGFSVFFFFFGMGRHRERGTFFPKYAPNFFSFFGTCLPSFVIDSSRFLGQLHYCDANRKISGVGFREIGGSWKWRHFGQRPPKNRLKSELRLEIIALLSNKILAHYILWRTSFLFFIFLL